MRNGLIPVGMAVGMLLLAGCAGSTSGSPTPQAGSSEAQRSASAPGSGASADVPRVTNPINMTQYKQHPCRALTEPQLQELSVPAAGKPQPDSVAGPECVWDAYDETGIVVNAGPITAGSSLAGSYAKHERGGFENFEPITVAGYPGYLHWDGDINCSAAVGVRDDLLYTVVVTVDTDFIRPGKHCEIAKKAAKLATRTMSGRS